MLFSLVIPTYNRAAYIEKTLASVILQTYLHFEIIIIDDGSTDNTDEIIQKFADSRIKYIKIPNSERGAARNAGISRALGDYITFLDSDDILLPDYFKNAHECILRYNRPPFLHLGYEILNENGQLMFKVDDLKNDDIYCLVKGNPLSCIGCFIRSDISKRFSFNEDRKLAGSEDWELWFRILANNGIKTDNRISARMYNHPQRSVAKSEEEKLVLRKELALKYAFSDPMVQQRYAGNYKEIDAFGDGYIALHLAISGDKVKSLHYVRKFIRAYPKAIFSKRFLVILKYIVLN